MSWLLLIAALLGAATALFGVWMGFRLARIREDEPLLPSLPERYEGIVLDSAVYPDQVADE